MMNRRDFIAIGSVAGAAFGVGIWPKMAQAQEASDTLTIALAARAPNGLNPQQSSLSGADDWSVLNVFDRLVANPEGRWAVRPEEFEPAIAESWSSSSDAREWTYRLRSGVRFHKGYGEVTADDVVFTFARHLDPKIVTRYKLYYANIASVEALDAMTVRFILKRPDPLFNGSCASQLTASILCRKAFEEKGDNFTYDAIGTGPYQLDGIERGRAVRLAAFPEHFRGPPVTGNIYVSFIADSTSRTFAFVSGEVDMIEGVRSPGWQQTMKLRTPGTIFDMTAPGSFNTLSLSLNRKPLDDLRVRQAIRHAIDNRSLAKAFGDLATPMVGIIAPQFAGSVAESDLPPELQYSHDPDRSRALLAEAGFTQGLTIPCYASQREDYAGLMIMVQEQLRQAGIHLDMRIIDHSTFHADNRQDKNSIVLNSSSFPPVPTMPFLRLLASRAEVKADGSGQENYSHYGVAIDGIDPLLEQAEDEPDFDRRMELMQEVERKVLSDLPMLGIVTLSYVIARNPRVDLGFNVESGTPNWSLAKARRVSQGA
ncbi:ABC transporter substrate-binding protein [Aureimonas altamirensis]|uniref:ABC transporter substrate-binding protein n=1 Tax=Aureimonas altamirensis TaxID=370622 RepID=UPI001E3E6DBA|nr:ABC transporter substrate-binding protein [Aureimonas altamirensis]UHD46450.1 ABC transporter substrate-binding protein [Aureimonas altamirensis]